MAQQDEIEQLLRRVAPLCLEVSYEAQRETDGLRNSDWGRRNLSRSASANQVAGTARRRIACDNLVDRCGQLGGVLEVSVTDSAQNQGQYYLRSTDPACVLTVRRKAHKEDDQPLPLQLQIAGMRELVELEDEVVVYLEIPPNGGEPCFEVTTRGRENITHRLCDLIAGEEEDDSGATTPIPGPRPTPPAPGIRSTLQRDESTADDSDGS
jgi:hypothetical protein